MRILFFARTLQRTGAEVALCRLIRHADRRLFEAALAYGTPGPLLDSLPGDVSAFNYRKGISLTHRAFNGLYRLAHRLVYKQRSEVDLQPFASQLKLLHRRVRPDVWYVNTLLQPRVVAAARDLGVPCVLHTHELENETEVLLPGEVRTMVEYPRLVIATSQAAAEVMRVLGRRGGLEVCHPPIDLDEIRRGEQRRVDVRASLGIPECAYVWAMVGPRSLNKHPVRFVRVAAKLLAEASDAHFMWIGGGDNGLSFYAKALADTLGVAGRITWLETRGGDYYDFLDAADGLALTSTQESLSLAAVDMAALGKPVVSFKSGGPRDLAGDGTVVIVDSCDEADMARAMLKIMRAPRRRAAASAVRRAAKFDVSQIARRWERLIIEHMAGAS